MAGLMELLASFRRAAPIGDPAALSAFLDRHAAFMVQKCIYEYARARSGLLSTKLLEEPAFKTAAERAKWRNYPLCLQGLAIMAEGVLRPHAEDARALAAGVAAAVGTVCRGYETPPGTAFDFWDRAEAAIAGRLIDGAGSPPCAVKDIPIETAEAFFANLPIHPDLRSYDFRLVTNNQRANLLRAYEAFLKEADPPRLARRLSAIPPARA
ncbi:hypothetical protein ABIE65_002939 [Constrictibacter sp. MBR-5]|uniref:hypothetical protein n=1 Tax=Constrictibacter sp. MBR-5 TaxID=3156467 RepID=UPI00339B481B